MTTEFVSRAAQLTVLFDQEPNASFPPKMNSSAPATTVASGVLPTCG